MEEDDKQIVPDSKIREIFLRNGFTIKEGHDDLKPYVYAAARDLIKETIKEQRNAHNRNM